MDQKRQVLPTRAVTFNRGHGDWREGSRGSIPQPISLLTPSSLLRCFSIDKPNRRPEGKVAVDTVHAGQPPRAQSRAEGEWAWRSDWEISSKAIFIIRLGRLMLPPYSGICHIKTANE